MTNSSSNSPVRKTTGHDSSTDQQTDHITNPVEVWHDLNDFQRDCLRAVAALDDPKGLRVKDRLDICYSSEVNHGQLYPNLDELVDLGLVGKDRIDGRSNAYRLTDRGACVLDARDELLQGGVYR